MSEPVSSTRRRILLISDIHYASDLECARGDYESRTVSQPLLRYFLKVYRRLIWRRDPFAMNGLLDALSMPNPTQTFAWAWGIIPVILPSSGSQTTQHSKVHGCA